MPRPRLLPSITTTKKACLAFVFVISLGLGQGCFYVPRIPTARVLKPHKAAVEASVSAQTFEYTTQESRRVTYPNLTYFSQPRNRTERFSAIEAAPGVFGRNAIGENSEWSVGIEFREFINLTHGYVWQLGSRRLDDQWAAALTADVNAGFLFRQYGGSFGFVANAPAWNNDLIFGGRVGGSHNFLGAIEPASKSGASYGHPRPATFSFADFFLGMGMGRNAEASRLGLTVRWILNHPFEGESYAAWETYKEMQYYGPLFHLSWTMAWGY